MSGWTGSAPEESDDASMRQETDRKWAAFAEAHPPAARNLIDARARSVRIGARLQSGVFQTMLTAALALAAALTVDSLPVAPLAPMPALRSSSAWLTPSADSTRRKHSIEYSDAYYTRLTIHRYG